MIRKEAVQKRRGLSVADQSRNSRLICERFLASPEYENARTILLYMAYNDEVDTDLIFERAMDDGKTVAYPVSKITDGQSELIFYIVKDRSLFKEGYKGIREPDPDKGCERFEGTADICITPGVAFDRNCNRIGYGKGVYDTYLRQNRPRTVIGIAYDIQITDDIETEECDIPVDIVITETAMFSR